MDYFDVLNFLIRSIHMIAGIAWIGASFYFVMLDTSLRAPRDPSDIDRGVFGEYWAVHGGGMYSSKKYLAGPKGEPLPNELHWSKWEAYTTWLSGASLLVLIYFFRAEVYLIDPEAMAFSKSQAIVTSVAFIAGFWVVYDLLCRFLKGVQEWVFTAALLFVSCLLAWGLCSLFSPRGAFMLFGACLGTVMAANVFFVIIPGQKKMVASIEIGEQPDPQPGLDGKQRSIHNTYFTLPVLFCMIVNHYAAFYSHQYNWLVLVAMCLSGVFIRLFFVSRHRQEGPSYQMALLGVVLLLMTLLVVYMPSNKTASIAQLDNQVQERIALLEVQQIITERCTVCHARAPSFTGFSSPPKGIIYESEEDILNQISQVYQQAVVLKAMPIGNLTGMTEQERMRLQQWVYQYQESQRALNN